MKLKLHIASAVFLLIALNSKANVYVVTSNASSGAGTLRALIDEANSHAGIDSVLFNLSDPSVSGRTIVLDSLLPDISDQLIIDGTSQALGTEFGISFTKIQITSSGSLSHCFNINADYCEVYGIFINGFQTGIVVNNPYAQIGAINRGNVIFNCTAAGIKIENTDHAAILTNLIGIDTAQNESGGTVGNGIDVLNCYAVAIGGHSILAGNVISGNYYGIKFDNSEFCDVNGNFIGTNSGGTSAIPNVQYGIRGTGLNSNIEIGGDSLFERNIISGNLLAGIYGNFSGATIQGNLIGTDVSGENPLGNGESGIYITLGSSDNLFGGEGLLEPNLIAFNGKEAIVFQGSTCSNNTVRRNTTFCNSQILGNGGFRFNNGNNHIDPPELTIANSNGVNGLTYPDGIIDIYQDDTCSHCEGKLLLASVAANNSGVFSYIGPLSGSITATVTDTDGNTSEYSGCITADNSNCIATQFTTSPAGICTNTLITFLDQTVTQPGSGLSSWQWTFGDGGTSFLQSPTHSYTTNGSYTITLITFNNLGCSDTISKTVNVTGGPDAAFQAPVESCIGSPVNPDDESTAGSGATISGWQWNFGDSGSSALQNPSHTYNAIGTFTITLTVTNSSGCTDFITSDITINPQPVAGFNFIQTGLQVSFTNSSVTTGHESFSWNFGDGIISNAQDPVHTYGLFSTYTACLTVYDSICATTDSECHIIDIPIGISNEMSNNIIIAPNPANDVLMISGSFSSQIENIKVLDMTGRKMMEEKVSPITSIIKLNLQSLPEGLYVIEIRSGKGTASRKINVIH